LKRVVRSKAMNRNRQSPEEQEMDTRKEAAKQPARMGVTTNPSESDAGRGGTVPIGSRDEARTWQVDTTWPIVQPGKTVPRKGR